MDFNFVSFLTIIGALGFFIYGMKVMSEGLQKAAGSKLRQILSAMTKNRFFGVFTGFLITTIVQSSSATTVMTVSFVNAGLMSLVESAGVMMGANVGTTITGWLISIFGFKVKIVTISLPIIAIGFPLLFSKKSKTRSIAEVLIGFALLFMGLDALKNAVPDLQQNPQVLEFLRNYTDMGIFSTILFIGIGAILTIIIQSSSAAMALTLVMCNEGWIPFEFAAGMILGENIGTTITAELASIVGNVHAKRSARIHSMFNVIGVTWMLFAMPLYLDIISNLVESSTNFGNPFDTPEAVPTALAFFHTAFNVSNVLILIWLVPFLVRLAIRTVPSKGDHDELFHLEYIDSGMMSTPELSLVEAGKEVAKYGSLTRKLANMIPDLIVETDSKKFNRLLERIKKYEEITDRMEIEIAKYLTKVSENEMSESTSNKVRSLLSIINDLERVGDICYQMSKVIERKAERKIWFTPEQRTNVQKMFVLADDAMNHMVQSLNSNYEQADLQKAKDLEKAINQMRNDLRSEHLKSMGKADYNFEGGLIYNDLFSSIEKIGDHVINVNEAIAGEI